MQIRLLANSVIAVNWNVKYLRLLTAAIACAALDTKS
eukprot:SAG31_NODE_15398_length_757_cov_0.934650_1_plen_36_part_01